jgi:hypothetical protein
VSLESAGGLAAIKREQQAEEKQQSHNGYSTRYGGLVEVALAFAAPRLDGATSVQPERRRSPAKSSGFSPSCLLDREQR